MRDMNKVFLIGRLGGDAELRDVNGSQVAKFNLATSKEWTKKDGSKEKKTIWFQVNAWGSMAPACAMLKKGESVFVTGELDARAYLKDGGPRASMEVRAFDVNFLSPKKKGTDEPTADADDDIPF